MRAKKKVKCSQLHHQPAQVDEWRDCLWNSQNLNNIMTIQIILLRSWMVLILTKIIKQSQKTNNQWRSTKIQWASIRTSSWIRPSSGHCRRNCKLIRAKINKGQRAPFSTWQVILWMINSQAAIKSKYRNTHKWQPRRQTIGQESVLIVSSIKTRWAVRNSA